MTKPETFAAKLVCPQCKRTGEATCEENPNPTHTGKLNRIILSTSKGFRPGGHLDGNEQVVCSICRILIPI